MGDKKILIVDLDFVICDSGFLHMINTFLGTNYQEADFTDYYMQDVVEDKVSFFEFLSKNNMYDYSIIYPYAKETLKELNEIYNLLIASSFIIPGMDGEGLKKLICDKFDFLQKNFPFLSFNQYSFIDMKKALKPFCKIDDKITNLEGAKLKLLYTAYNNIKYNKDNLDNQKITRVNDWQEIKRILIK